MPAAFFDDVPAGAGVGAVALANQEGVALLVEHLVGVHGHRRIAYLGSPDTTAEGATPPIFSSRERLEGFRAAVGRAGVALPPEYVRTIDPLRPEQDVRSVAAELLAGEPRPTAVIGGSDTLAVAVLAAARDAGLRVPEDVAVVSFDEPAYADLLDPPVTSLDRHDRELGRRAARLLLDALGGAPGKPGVVRMPLALQVRRSCGCGVDRSDVA